MSTAAVLTQDIKPELKICEHIKDDGIRCGTPAIRGRHFCYHHSRCHAPSHLGTRLYRAPIPECIASLQLTIMQITQALGSGAITEKLAGRLLYAVQLSTNLLKMKELKDKKNEPDGAPFKPAVGLSGVVTNADVTTNPKSEGEVIDSLETRNPKLETVLSPAMVQALAPHPIEPLDEPEPQPKPITRREFDSLIEQLMTDAQIRALRPSLDECEGNPAYDRATRRLSAHYDALQKLQDAGITAADPRLAPFRRPQPQTSKQTGFVADGRVFDDPMTQSPDHPMTPPEPEDIRDEQPTRRETPSSLTEEEMKCLARNLLTREEYSAVQSIARAGKSHPEYDDAVRRMYDHAEALLKLRRTPAFEQYAPPNCQL